jgi:hypothetical protein
LTGKHRVLVAVLAAATDWRCLPTMTVHPVKIESELSSVTDPMPARAPTTQSSESFLSPVTTGL